ncbi:putative udptransferase [Phaeomoniella chlamydospora]|uniref:Putative udptransferase n=1 Tax=Phaeomoniella chlamydospora TaxID=158046 RepID=A0A0G2GBV1_PHACM|nr:putative udptransferase [Phaeomoniella chlamydospora]
MESNGTISVLGHSPQDKPECPPSYDVVEENHSGTYNKSLDATSRIDEQHPNRRGYWGRQANDRRSWNLPEAVPQQYFNSRITPLTNDERSQELNDSPYPSSEGVTSPQSDTAERVIRGLKVPVNITVAAAKAFHNAPRLYGDPTVRENRKVTGIASGFKEAGKELGFGFYDGFTGLVTQPINGAIQQGPLGFAKGLISGSMGVLIKPGAAASGLVGYSLKGLHKELEKRALKAEAKMAVSRVMVKCCEILEMVFLTELR